MYELTDVFLDQGFSCSEDATVIEGRRILSIPYIIGKNDGELSAPSHLWQSNA